MAKQESGLSEKPDNRCISDFRGEFELMKDFIESNPDLQSRFNKYTDFLDYYAEKLMMIFAKFVAQNRILDAATFFSSV